jgi:hypothetical protein
MGPSEKNRTGFLLGQNLPSVLFVIPKGDWKLKPTQLLAGQAQAGNADICSGYLICGPPLFVHGRC